MSFVSPEFGLLCLLFFPLYWACANLPRVQRSLLIVSGYALYASWVPAFAGVLLIYSTVVWGLGRWMAAASKPRLPWVLGLWLAGTFLVTLKYYEWVRETFQAMLSPWGFHSMLPVVDVVAPVGVSFFTFQAITYLVAVGRRDLAARSWADVILFLSFWPTLFAGPILRAVPFFEQIDADLTGRPRQAWRALYLLMLGVVQKVVLASWLSSHVVDAVFKFPEQYSSGSIAAALLAYSLQIFFDFAGYTAIVTGLALLLGYELPLNFRQPYLARNLADFWTRWHMSLSSFIRDYIYIPLGGNQHGWRRTQLHVLLAMLISGMWHGASWTFVCWGLMHGLGVVGLNVMRRWGMPAWPRFLAQMLTFVFVSLAWVWFRSDSVEQAMQVFQGLWISPPSASTPLPVWPWLACIALAFWALSPWAPTLENTAVRVMRALGAVGTTVCLFVVLTWAIYAGPDGVPSFIYYRF